MTLNVYLFYFFKLEIFQCCWIKTFMFEEKHAETQKDSLLEIIEWSCYHQERNFFILVGNYVFTRFITYWRYHWKTACLLKLSLSDFQMCLMGCKWDQTSKSWRKGQILSHNTVLYCCVWVKELTHCLFLTSANSSQRQFFPSWFISEDKNFHCSQKFQNIPNYMPTHTPTHPFCIMKEKKREW